MNMYAFRDSFSSIGWTLLGVSLSLVGFKLYCFYESFYSALFEDFSEDRLQDGIDILSLGLLTRSDNVSLKRSATQILLDRAMHTENIKKIISSALPESPHHLRVKATASLSLLAKNEENREKLIRFGALQSLISCLK
eukprot:Sdes_comp17923_c0_seq1m7179